MDVFATALFTAGSLLVLLAGVGVMRFPDTMARMHAAAKAPVLGFMLIGAGVVVSIGTWEATALVLLAVVLQMIAVPVGSHVLARSIYHRMHPDLDGPDELAATVASDASADAGSHRDDQSLSGRDQS